MRRGDAFLRQPLTDDTLGGLAVVTVSFVAELFAQAQEQLLSHGVVAEFVDVTNDFHQVRRKGLGQQLGIAGQHANAIFALNGTAQFLPDGSHCAGRIGRVVQQ